MMHDGKGIQSLFIKPNILDFFFYKRKYNTAQKFTTIKPSQKRQKTTTQDKADKKQHKRQKRDKKHHY